MRRRVMLCQYNFWSQSSLIAGLVSAMGFVLPLATIVFIGSKIPYTAADVGVT